ncbi:MAG: diguanylate cyclase [Thiotrichales bacterium]|nr:diguanylate cyclase [Thiotrichales bacterium]MBT3614054.1 diguanylate cyclase [Thiotrichales bacterium]MBT4151493.1 diguanylate cyclase [Thiotrichales bacterium]MBT4260887.1 diguanylate cyclase [Thiotrichales bacterium]MBT5290545.1 diguanylate cyclase [Thiotrichales bacterium]
MKRLNYETISRVSIKGRTLKQKLYLGIGAMLLSIVAMSGSSFYLLVQAISETDQLVMQEFKQQEQDAFVVTQLEQIIGQAQGYTTIWDEAVLEQYRADIRQGIFEITEIVSNSSRPQILQSGFQSSLEALSNTIEMIFDAHDARANFFFVFEEHQYDLSRFVMLVHRELDQWILQLRDAAQFNVPFKGNLDTNASLFERWYPQYQIRLDDLELERMLDRYRTLNQKAYRFAIKVNSAEGDLRMSHFTRGINRQIYKARRTLTQVEAHISPRLNQVNLSEAEAVLDLMADVGDFREMIDLYRDEGGVIINEARERLFQLQQRVYNFLYWGIFLAIVFSIVFVTRFVRTIHQPIHSITNTIRTIAAEGVLTYRTEVYGVGEIADAADSLNHLLNRLEEMFSRTQALMNEVVAGNFSDRIDTEVTGDLLQLKQSINQGVGEVHASMEEINRVLIAISFGNYGYRVEGDYQGALEITKANINLAAAALEKKTTDLEQAKDMLELRVIERTHQLEESNRNLEKEIGQRKLVEEKLKRMAHYDVLTGLPNRMLLMDRLQLELRRADREKTHLALLFLDLDGFKAVNDTLGHKAGDLLLIEVAHRLRALVREVDTVSRLGGDEFVILLGDWESGSFIDQFAEKLIKELSKPITVEREEAKIGVSMGIAFYPDHAETQSDLLKFADQAMYQAKKQGKGQFCYYGECSE